MASNTASALALANTLLDDAQKDALRSLVQFNKSADRRRYVAYTLKAISVFGGLVVATGKVPDATYVGIVISIAVILDQWSSNHDRMLSEKVGANAIARTQMRVGNAYNDQLTEVARVRDAGDPARAEGMAVKLATESAKALRDELDRIRTKVAGDDIEFLGSLNIDRPASTTVPQVGP